MTLNGLLTADPAISVVAELLVLLFKALRQNQGRNKKFISGRKVFFFPPSPFRFVSLFPPIGPLPCLCVSLSFRGEAAASNPAMRT